MLNFFIAKIPFSSKSTNFVVAILFFANFGFTAINVNTAGNAEIASFIENESAKILQIPDSATLTLNFQNAKDNHGRAGFLFFCGERRVSINADYTLALPGKDIIKGSLKSDSSWITGYCGMIECQNKPMPAEQRIETLKALVSKMFAELNIKLYGVWPSP